MGSRRNCSPTMVWQLTKARDHRIAAGAAGAARTSSDSQWKKSEIVAGERRRIAREIHDGVAQDLAALSLKVGLCQRKLKNDPPGLHAELDEIRTILDTTLVELRRIICGLRPISLEEHGFLSALHALAAEFSAERPIYVHLTTSGDERHLPRSLELDLFRVTQEALNNVAQHAQATFVQITLCLMPDGLTLSIEDNGCGFTSSTLRDQLRQGHLGLQQMRERVAAHHGMLSIRSEVGRGTRIVATFRHA